MSLDSTVYIALLGVAACVSALVFRYVSSLRAASYVRAERPVYQEWFASGHSEKNLVTKFGGARSCLRVVVTDRHLWVTSWPPFALLAPIYDLEHIIPLGSILLVERRRFLCWHSLVVTFADERGCTHTLRLIPRHPDQFLNALSLPPGKVRQQPVEA